MQKTAIDGKGGAGRTKTVRITHLRYEVWKATKLRAVEEERPLVDLLSDALSEYLAKRAPVDGVGRRAQNGGKRL